MEGQTQFNVLCVLTITLMALFWLYDSTTANHLPGQVKKFKEVLVTKDIQIPEAHDRNHRSSVKRERHKQDTTKPRLIVILAYMHTGSSYTGSLFQQHPGTFYDYEALRDYVSSIRNNHSLQYLDGSYRHIQVESLGEGGGEREVVQQLLSCKFKFLNMGSLDAYFYEKQESTVFKNRQPFLECLRKHRQHNTSDALRSRNIQTCLPHLTKPCLNAKIRAFKFILLPMSAVKRLLNDNETLKIIHLVRDPRAMLDSQIRKNDSGSRGLTCFIENTKEVCDAMLKDLKIYKNLPDNVRKHIKRVRYEDLTNNQLETVREIFEFTHVSVTVEDATYVESTSFKDGRKPMQNKLSKWRRHLTQPFLEVVDRHCRPLYKELGYIEYSDIADIRDMRKSTYRRTITTT